MKKFFGVTIAVLALIVLVATICVKEGIILNNSNNNNISIQTKSESQKNANDSKKGPSQQSNTVAPSDTTKKPEDKKPLDPGKDTAKQTLPGKNEPMVALTFDDGPHPQNTILILNALKKYNGHATFFVVGNRAESFPSVVKQIYSNGNEIGNHSYSHKQLTTLNNDGINKELNKTSDIIQNIIQRKPSIIRPTYGSVNSRVKTCSGAPLILWSIDTLDWKTKNKASTVNNVVGKVKDGDIVLMHDLYKPTAQAAEVIIQKLSSQGFKLVTIDELFAARGVKLESGQVYSSAYKKK